MPILAPVMGSLQANRKNTPSGRTVMLATPGWVQTPNGTAVGTTTGPGGVGGGADGRQPARLLAIRIRSARPVSIPIPPYLDFVIPLIVAETTGATCALPEDR